MQLADHSGAMPALRHFIVAACLLALPAHAQETPGDRPLVRDVVFKGVVGKALDVVPMDPDQRVVLQRANAVVSSTFTGRTLTVWAGLTNPILLVAGMAWGVYSASHIKFKSEIIKLDADTMRVDLVDADEGEPVAVAQFFGPVAERDAYESTLVATLNK